MTKDKEKENVLERLSTDIEEVSWDALVSHHERDALFLVDQSLELPAVGLAMHRDEVTYIQQWLKNEELAKPTDEQIEVWKENNARFMFLIIQPYVLCKLITAELQ